MEYKYLEVSGKRIRYIEEGQGPAILYVHGNLGSLLWWKHVMDLPGYRCIAPDMPNFGGSDPLDAADLDVYADYLIAFAKGLGLDSFCLVGHSLGGGVAISLAARKPELVKKLLLLDSAAPSGLKTPEEHYPYIEMYRSNKAFLKQGLAGVAPGLKDEAFLQALTEEGFKMAGHAFIGNAKALTDFDYSSKAGNYKGPVFVVRGKADALITEAMAMETKNAYNNAKLLELDGIGHSPMVEDPAKFKELLLEFLA
ncbi:alpha/beta fold hydrolase [Spirochaetota bacterium]